MIVLKFTARLIIVGAVLAGLTSCTQWLFKADMADYSDNRPALKLEEFFDGRSYAYGIFEDRFGNLKRQFRVQIDGRTAAGRLTLDEQFIYDDGEAARRVWTIDNLGSDGLGFIRYQGRAEDIDGVATGQIAGNVLSWSYDIVLSISGKQLQVRFDDFIYQLDQDIAINRAFVSKWGVEIGSVTLVFLRGRTAALMPQMNLSNW
ncbi:MAG: hypothetical protein CMM80_06200 [Rhodospirillaceae bacterium]|nr:hypothetical protein [Rhodospirillaceae bacterium]